MIDVRIVAPTPALRAGLRSLLSDEGLRVIGEGALLSSEIADALVLSGEALPPDAAATLRDAGRPGLVLLSDEPRAAATLRGLPVRGWAALSRDAGPSELVAAVRAVAEGLLVLAPALAEPLFGARQMLTLAEPLAEPLTARELEVLQLVSQGLSNKLIARELVISEHTVKFHLSSTFGKLGAVSRTDAINRAARQGLVVL